MPEAEADSDLGTVVVGPCECGGYGVVYGREARQERGLPCHHDLDEIGGEEQT